MAEVRSAPRPVLTQKSVLVIHQLKKSPNWLDVVKLTSPSLIGNSMCPTGTVYPRITQLSHFCDDDARDVGFV